jgi:Carboxypeptidase regulatory-like domain
MNTLTMLPKALNGRGWKTLRRFARMLSNSQAVALVVLCAALFFAMKHSNAQDITGRIVGTVTDPSGAAIPGAKVTVVNEATQSARQITADQNGYFVADQLPNPEAPEGAEGKRLMYKDPLAEQAYTKIS